MNCPSCQHPTFLEPIYKDNLCKNKTCSLYLKGDVVNFKTMNSNNLSEQIDEILECFNFERVHKVMCFLNWHWQDKVPSLEEIKASAKDLLERCVEESKKRNSDFTIKTGGFATYCSFKDNFIQLTFELDEWSAE